MTNQKSWRGEVDLVPGDLIEIFRPGYQHWAVYVGLGDVIHLAPPSEYANAGAASMKSLLAKRAMVKREPVSTVVGKDRYCVSNKHDSIYNVRTQDQIVSMARKLEGKIMDYDLTTQNCEHFSNCLRYGKPRCDQVTKAVWYGMAAALAVLLL